MDGEASPRKQERRMKTSQRSFAGERRRTFGRRRRLHDPMLVLNMSIFNFDDGWNRIFNQRKVHENAPG
jgi:hypothetical protein